MSAALPALGRLQRILLATDGSEHSDGAIRVAAEAASQCGARVQVVSVALYNPNTESLEPTLNAEAERLAMANVETARDCLGPHDCEIRVLSDTDPARAIVAAAAAMRADLVIMGRHGRRGLARWKLGHATEKVVGKAPCPVLVVPSRAGMWQNNILLATDGSQHGDAAAAMAGMIAQACRLPLTAVSAVHTSHSTERRQDARAALERLAAVLAQGGVSVASRMPEGRPDQAILETARMERSDLIVMGSHGRSGLDKILMGSTSERVLNQSACPVLITRA